MHDNYNHRTELHQSKSPVIYHFSFLFNVYAFCIWLYYESILMWRYAWSHVIFFRASLCSLLNPLWPHDGAAVSFHSVNSRCSMEAVLFWKVLH